MATSKLGLIGKKIGMTQVFAKGGELVPVTVIVAGPCTVVQKRTAEKDGYEGVQLGFGEKKTQRMTKAEREHRKKAGRMVATLREFRGAVDLEVGGELKVGDLFQEGDLVDVTGVTKGRGYQGVIKRHGFSGFPATHGTHEYFRHGGSIGNRTHPGRVFKNKRMAGQMGAVRVTTQNLAVVAVRPDDNVLLLRGAVPGARGGLVFVRPAVKASGGSRG
ncbi:MAG: 50S ribosomal protein L3 [Deltaproteobacteria bacterium]|nr:50S ribosomal protein L3 [Deltaproteobacteria bacterium]